MCSFRSSPLATPETWCTQSHCDPAAWAWRCCFILLGSLLISGKPEWSSSMGNQPAVCIYTPPPPHLAPLLYGLSLRRGPVHIAEHQNYRLSLWFLGCNAQVSAHLVWITAELLRGRICGVWFRRRAAPAAQLLQHVPEHQSLLITEAFPSLNLLTAAFRAENKMLFFIIALMKAEAQHHYCFKLTLYLYLDWSSSFTFIYIIGQKGR